MTFLKNIQLWLPVLAHSHSIHERIQVVFIVQVLNYDTMPRSRVNLNSIYTLCYLHVLFNVNGSKLMLRVNFAFYISLTGE